MSLDSAETSPSSSFAGDELSPVSVSLQSGSPCQPLSLSLFLFLADFSAVLENS